MTGKMAQCIKVSLEEVEMARGNRERLLEVEFESIFGGWVELQ